MEALPSDFHVGDMGMEVLGSCRDRWVLSRTCGLCGAGVLLPEHRNKMKQKPCKSAFTERERQRGGGRGSVWLLVRPLGCVVDVEGGVFGVLLPENTRIKKKPCKHRFTGILAVS